MTRLEYIATITGRCKKYVASHSRQRDIHHCDIPHVLERYAKIQGDYYIDGVLAKKSTKPEIQRAALYG